MKYTAPLHTADASLSTGIVLVGDDGILDVPDVTEGDHAGLIHSGFVVAPDGAPAAKPLAKVAAPAPVPAPAAASDA